MAQSQSQNQPKAVALPPIKGSQLPDTIYYVDVDNSNLKIKDWNLLLDAIPDTDKTYVVLVMNFETMKQKTSKSGNPYNQLTRHTNNIAIFVTPVYPGLFLFLFLFLFFALIADC